MQRHDEKAFVLSRIAAARSEFDPGGRCDIFLYYLADQPMQSIPRPFGFGARPRYGVDLADRLQPDLHSFLDLFSVARRPFDARASRTPFSMRVAAMPRTARHAYGAFPAPHRAAACGRRVCARRRRGLIVCVGLPGVPSCPPCMTHASPGPPCARHAGCQIDGSEGLAECAMPSLEGRCRTAVFFRVRPPLRDFLSAQARDMLRFSSLAARHCKSASEVAARILSRREQRDASPAKLRRRSPERFRYGPKPVIPRNSGIGASALRQIPLSTSLGQKTAVAISAALAMLPHIAQMSVHRFASGAIMHGRSANNFPCRASATFSCATRLAIRLQCPTRPPLRRGGKNPARGGTLSCLRPELAKAGAHDV